MRVMIDFMSLSVLLNEVRLAVGFIRCLVIDCDLANSRSPSAPWIRPKPDSPTPPNGSDGTLSTVSAEFTDAIPVRSDLAARMAAFLFLENTLAPRP